jgi:hypothetical protein
MMFVWSPAIPIVVTLLILVGSLVVLYGFSRILGGTVRRMDREQTDGDAAWECDNRGCHAPNPAHGRFCRMCGRRRRR